MVTMLGGRGRMVNWGSLLLQNLSVCFDFLRNLSVSATICVVFFFF